jgi:septum formation protein
MRVVLASESQSRKRAMDILGLTYEVCPSAIDEKSIRDSDPAVLTRKLAEAKAWKVANRLQGAVVVSGDAVVAKDGEIFEKPRDNEEAAEFLRELSGSTFQFVTSLTVIHSDTKRMLSTVETW